MGVKAAGQNSRPSKSVKRQKATAISTQWAGTLIELTPAKPTSVWMRLESDEGSKNLVSLGYIPGRPSGLILLTFGICGLQVDAASKAGLSTDKDKPGIPHSRDWECFGRIRPRGDVMKKQAPPTTIERSARKILPLILRDRRRFQTTV